MRDTNVHRDVLQRVLEQGNALGLGARALIASPILGPEGNREFLLEVHRGPNCADIVGRIGEVTAS